MLDSGVMLREAKALLADWTYRTYPESDRYQPALVATYSIAYKLFGSEVFYYYLSQILFLAATSVLIWAAVHRLTGNGSAGLLAGLLFLTASPVVENYYTLCKQETRLIFFWLLSLFFWILSAEPTRAQSGRSGFRILLPALSFVTLLLALLSKETAVLTLPALAATLTVLFLGRMAARSDSSAFIGKAATSYLWISLAALGVAFVLVILSGTPLPFSGRYTGERFSFGGIPERLTEYLSFGFDLIALCALTLVLLFGLLRSGFPKTREWVFFAYSVFCAAAYLLFLVVAWRQVLSYYLLPVAAWTALALGILVGYLQQQGRAVRIPAKKILVFLLLLIAVTRFFSIPVGYSSAIAHKIWTRVNADLLEWMARLPPESRVIFTFPRRHGYQHQSELLLQHVYGRTDLRFANFPDAATIAREARPGDIILVTFGRADNHRVRVRAMTMPLLEDLKTLIINQSGTQMDVVFRTERNDWVVAPFLSGLFHFGLGWEAYRLESAADLFVEKYGDGWLSKAGRIGISAGLLPATLVCRGRSFLPPAVPYPINLTLRLPSGGIQRHRVEAEGAFEFRIELNGTYPADEWGFVSVQIESDKTFLPQRDLGTADSRELSVILESVHVER